ncbi:MAG: SDR family NAD(P)-dependent oxidoreductase [Hyphomicrobiaceae bacterium]
MADRRTVLPELLKGHLVLVTGAGQGNGRAIALGLAGSGARIVVTDIQSQTAAATVEDIRRAGGAADAFRLDVTDAKACAELAERVGRDIGAASILVNNAGIQIREDLDSPHAHETWRRVLDVNLNGTFNVVHAWLPALRQTRGSIINVASIASFVVGSNTLGYAPSKGAIKLFTQALARELAPDGIRVNAVAPGVIETAMTEATRADPDRLAAFMKRIPLGRVGQPEDVVGPVLFLASPMASYVTGAILPVDGGYLAV